MEKENQPVKRGFYISSLSNDFIRLLAFLAKRTESSIIENIIIDRAIRGRNHPQRNFFVIKEDEPYLRDILPEQKEGKVRKTVRLSPEVYKNFKEFVQATVSNNESDIVESFIQSVNVHLSQIYPDTQSLIMGFREVAEGQYDKHSAITALIIRQGL